MLYIILFFLAISFSSFSDLMPTRADIIGELCAMADAERDALASIKSDDSRHLYEEEARQTRTAYNAYDKMVESWEERVRLITGLCDQYIADLSENTPLDTVFQRLLLQRLTDLSSSTDYLSVYFGNEYLEPDVNRFLVPTLPALYNSDYVLKDACNKNQYNRRIDYYQHMQRILRMLFNALNPEEIGPQSIRLLSMSPQLWPFLTGETNNPGNPDEAGGYAPLYFLYNELKGSYKNGKRMRHLMEEVFKDYNAALEGKALGSHYLQTKEKTHIKLLRFRQGFNGKPGCDGQIYLAYEELAEGVSEALADPETWPRELPMPPFLARILEERQKSSLNIGPSLFDTGSEVLGKKQRKKKKKPAAEAAEARDQVAVAAAQEETVLPGGSAARMDTSEVDEPRASAGPEAVSLDVSSEAQGVGAVVSKTTGKKRKKKKSHNTSVAAEAAPAFNALAPADQGEEAAAAAADTPAFVYPRGIRGRSVLRFERSEPRTADAHVQSFINRLFDPSQVDHITLKDFKTAWEHVGGTLEGADHGGSHRSIVNSDGRTLWGTYDHGGFGPETIRYLQAAFWFEGYRPQ